jgi:flagellar hook-associated protein 2
VAGSSSIGGLASGLDTASIIDQLMQLEAVPQNRLKTEQSNQQAIQSALRTLNTTTSLLGGTAEKLAKAATWQTLKGSVTGTGVSVSVGTSAAASSFSVTVKSLAASHQVGYAAPVALTDHVVSGSSVTITAGGVAYDVPTAGGSLKELVDGINAKTGQTGVNAVAVQASGGYRLLVQSASTGVDSEFTLAGVDTATLGAATTQLGRDAEISLGAVTATSSTNTFANLLPGVSITLDSSAKVDSTASVTVAQDPTSMKTMVGDFVDKVNSLLESIDTQSAVKTDTTAAGVLAGDVTVRTLRNQLLETVFGGTGSMSEVGIQTDRYGKLVFDPDKFASAFAADPASVAAKFTTGTPPGPDGWAARVAAVAKGASSSTSGTITADINGRKTSIDRLTKSIEDWDDRLVLRRTTLERQYTALETALSNLQSQSSWLSGQIASLPSYS